MKQLTQEQVDSIALWLSSNVVDAKYLFDNEAPIESKFRDDFPAACCDECSEGHTCESDGVVTMDKEAYKQMAEMLNHKREVQSELAKNNSEFDEHII